MDILGKAHADVQRETTQATRLMHPPHPHCAFEGMAIQDASIADLLSSGRSLRTRNILHALQAGGLARTGKKSHQHMGRRGRPQSQEWRRARSAEASCLVFGMLAETRRIVWDFGNA
jgi:hypothetical protein